MSQKRVIKISHLPEDFNESKLIAYAKQFGCKSVKVYLPRSHETFKSRGYAFMLLDKEVCDPFMETLNNKFMFNKVLKCEYVSKPSKNTFRKRPLLPFSKSGNEKIKQNAHLQKRKVNEDMNIRSAARKRRSLANKLKQLKDFQFTAK